MKSFSYTCDNCGVAFTIRTNDEEELPSVCPFCGELLEDTEEDEDEED